MMKLPPALRAFINSAQWHEIDAGRLDDEGRRFILEVLEAAFKGQEPRKIKESEVAEVVTYAKGLADDLAKGLDENDEVSKGDLIAAENTVREIRREDKAKARKLRSKQRKP